ncbi:hypothetical protein GCM10010191_03770 [Actinomadura vinacea]|uniref:Transposase n=1 Tax=Actinomadura vinacea TaxID=115336 RepID=A0ABN3IB92_9ACTN
MSRAATSSAGVPAPRCGAGPAGDKSVSALAKSLGISQSCLSDRVRQADAGDGRSDGLTSQEKKELVELRRKTRQLELENQILKQAAAYFARENVVPK